MLPAMLIVMLAWLILFVLMVGFGQWVRSRFGLRLDSIEAWFAACWMGYAVVIAGVQLWHLVLPIDWRVCVASGIIGIIWYVWYLWHVKWRSVRLTRGLIAKALLTIIVFAPIVIWVAYRGLDAQMDFDSGLYHLSLIHWLNAYPVVPGLGNLHYRLAFNQTFFLFVAALNVYPFFNEGIHIANSFLLIVLAFQLTASMIDSLFRPRSITLDRVLSALFLPVVLYRASSQPYSANMSSPSPDLSAFIFQVVVILAFVKFLWVANRPDTESHDNEQRFSAFFCISLSLVGITSKLSFAGFGVSIIALVLIVWLWQRRQQMIAALRSSVLWLIIAGIGLGLPWVAHGILTSGYPAFPSTFGALPVDYRVPTAITTDAADWVFTFARDPHGDSSVTLHTWDWLPGWEYRMSDEFDQFLFVLPLYASGIALAIYGLLLVLLALIRRSPPSDHRLWLPLLPTVVSAVFWFFTAPDPRFAGAAFWILTLWSAMLVLNLLNAIRLPLFVMRVGIVVPLAVGLTVIAILINNDGFSWDRVDFPPLAQVAMKPYQTDSGLVVNIPADPNNPLQLWDPPLPASPYPLPELELRGSDLSAGFRMRSQ